MVPIVITEYTVKFHVMSVQMREWHEGLGEEMMKKLKMYSHKISTEPCNGYRKYRKWRWGQWCWWAEILWCKLMIQVSDILTCIKRDYSRNFVINDNASFFGEKCNNWYLFIIENECNCIGHPHIFGYTLWEISLVHPPNLTEGTTTHRTNYSVTWLLRKCLLYTKWILSVHFRCN